MKARILQFFQTEQTSFIGLFLLIVLVRFWPFFLGKTLFFGDNYSLMVPGKIFIAQWLRQGVLPLWNPHIFSGLSIVGDINQSLLYPSTLLFVFFSAALALKINTLTHLLILMWGMYLLLKKLGAERIWALLGAGLLVVSPRVTGASDNLTILQSLIFMPWIMWSGLSVMNSRTFRYSCASFIFLQLLGGYPQHLMFSLLSTGVIFLLFGDFKFKNKREWFKLVVSWIEVGWLSFLLSAVVLLPFIETFLSSTRLHQTAAQATGGSLHPVELIKIVLPYFFDHPQSGLRWGPSWNDLPQSLVYVTWLGLVVLAQSLITKSVLRSKFRILAGVIIISLLFSLGRFLPGFTLIQKFLPIFRVGRNPGLILEMVNVLLITWLVKALPVIKNFLFNLKILQAGLAVLSLLSLVMYGWVTSHPDQFWQVSNQLVGNRLSSSLFHTLERWQVIWQVNFWYLCLASLFLVIALVLWQKKLWQFLVVMLVLEASVFSQANLFFAPDSIYYSSRDLVTQPWTKLLNDPQHRVLTRNMNQPYTDFGSYWEALRVRQPFSDSFIGEEEKSSLSLLDRLGRGLTPAWNVAAGMSIVNGYTTLVPRDYERLWEDGPARITALDKIELDNQLLAEWAVGYYLVDSWFYTPEDLSGLELLSEEEWWHVYRLPSLARFRLSDGEAVRLSGFEETPNRVEISFDNLSAESSLVMADRFDHNWRAEVNGKEVILGNINGMRQVPISVGKNQVVFEYQSRLFFWGVIISTLTAVFMMWSYRRHI